MFPVQEYLESEDFKDRSGKEAGYRVILFPAIEIIWRANVQRRRLRIIEEKSADIISGSRSDRMKTWYMMTKIPVGRRKRLKQINS